ncbi:MAG: bifunctional phosphopantothenoylcysteine decarboxylase/phosphopantothenate--cysteine ligase CoaBC [Candidatus Amulumruptor caecigallinarius]|nr:bifunctional phosphopantothenoylcysteine decarboxylase/phosphopantothenate--cysteine ligase CoaBC [Candidatus Amulumruptor caecigallinarius]MCM1397297.1 bifunctional phosphopantothenoylcysteine decarboxylase/phosphopantothenate--cysteine ligase CoaBC [Candidatus Amulumruptor caecigallinarius]MCM1453638.1 bifunctional phosphopantothenoylcysteine decarboxylase/phosphopantothenate--cysteine ligase CoaBC [bacterium]
MTDSTRHNSGSEHVSPLKGKHIVLGVTGGIAAYKAAMLIRLLVKKGVEVQPVMTPAAKEFITPLTLSTLSGKPVISEFFTRNTGEWHSHVDLGLWADAMVVAPATASTIAKMATGVADNMLVTTYLSAKAPVFVAPAMDLDMMAHPSTSRNLATLRADGVTIIEPAEGELASHLCGKGRMEEPEEIVKVLERYFTEAQSGCGNPQGDTDIRHLAGKRVLITAGPTYERIDPVRFIGNFSTGRMGFALAAEAAARGAEVILVAGPVSLDTPAGNIRRIDVESAHQMLQACEQQWPQADMAVMCAAVADYAPAHPAELKIKREGSDAPVIELVKNPDIAAILGAEKRPGQILVGFALETNDAATHATDKLRRKNLDYIVVNTLEDAGAGFGTTTNKVTVISAEGEVTPFPLKDKRAVAADILDVTTSRL